MEELSKVRAILKREGIKYSYKVIDPSGQWLGPGTSRGNFGSIGMNKNYEKQYVVSVKKKTQRMQNILFIVFCIHKLISINK